MINCKSTVNTNTVACHKVELNKNAPLKFYSHLFM